MSEFCELLLVMFNMKIDGPNGPDLRYWYR